MTVNGTTVSMVRGDTERISVTPSVAFAAGDIVTMTVRKDVESTIELQKIVTEFDNGAAYIDITHEDTETMDFGAYVYDIQVQWGGSGAIKTLIKKSTFNLEEEVTY